MKRLLIALFPALLCGSLVYRFHDRPKMRRQVHTIRAKIGPKVLWEYQTTNPVAYRIIANGTNWFYAGEDAGWISPGYHTQKVLLW